jgi:hypothetical protein
VTLIEAESDRALLEAEDAAIMAGTIVVDMVDGGTVEAEAGSPLADLIGLLNDDPPQVHSETTG